MTGVRMEFSFNDRALSADLRDRVRRLKNKAPILKSIGEHFKAEIPMRFRHERGPEGKWAPLASATVSKRLQRYGNRPVTILRQEGELYSSIQYQTTASSLMIGTRSGSAAEPYAAIHQFGGKAGRGKKVTITARPYLGFADDDMDVIEDEVAAFLAGS